MSVIQSISATGYRSLVDVHVALAPVSVLVGPNGSGKSNVLDALQFLGSVARQDLLFALASRSGLERVQFRGAADIPGFLLSIKAVASEFATERAPDEYGLIVRPAGADIFRYEWVYFKRSKGAGRRIGFEGAENARYDHDAEMKRVNMAMTGWLEERFGDSPPAPANVRLQSPATALATLPKLADADGAVQMRAIADLLRELRVFDVNVPFAVVPCKIDDEVGEVRLEPTASNLAAFLYATKKYHPAAFDAIEADLARIVPSVRGIRLTPLSGASSGVLIELDERPLKTPIHLGEASFGTVRALALLAMLHDPDPPRITCIEEIDHGLHPHAIELIVERVREASARSQMIIATHSPALVNRLDASELIVCERDPESGASKIPAIDAHTVRKKEKASGLGLGELWFSGTLGGGL